MARTGFDPTEILETTLTMPDAWGRDRVVTVAWIPELADGIDLACDNVGMTPVVWGSEDEPPVFLAPGLFGSVDIKRAHGQVTGDYQQNFMATRVHSREELEPGTYFIVSDSDRPDEDEGASQ